MARSVKEFIDVTDQGSLDQLIDRLIAVRDQLPSGSQAEVRMRGDDVFGRKLSVSFKRPQTPEEAECDARYAEAYRQSREQEAARLSEVADDEIKARGARRLRMVA